MKVSDMNISIRSIALVLCLLQWKNLLYCNFHWAKEPQQISCYIVCRKGLQVFNTVHATYTQYASMYIVHYFQAALDSHVTSTVAWLQLEALAVCTWWREQQDSVLYSIELPTSVSQAKELLIANHRYNPILNLFIKLIVVLYYCKSCTNGAKLSLYCGCRCEALHKWV